MRLEGELYRKVRECRTDAGWDFTVEILPSSRIFEGHFPGMPVVPGVCTLTIIRERLSQLTGREVMFREIKEVKYTSAIIPREGLQVQFSLALDGDSLKGTAVCDGVQAIKISATIGER